MSDRGVPRFSDTRIADTVRAVRESALHGLSFGAPTELEIEMAETLCRLLPSMEMVRLVSSGTEATMTAIRLARGFTGRTKIVKFEGCYHGHGDSLLVKAGSGALTFGQPSSAGVPASIAGETIVLSYNDLDQVAAAFDAHPGEIAGIIVEPVAGNMNLIAPNADFLAGASPARGSARRGAHLRRGHDRLPAASARCARLVRCCAGSHHARQGDWRRHAGRRIRRPARHHGKDSAARAGVSGGHAIRAIPSPSRRGLQR